MFIMIGQEILHYRSLEKLGQGGLGAVLVALAYGDMAVEMLESVLNQSGRSIFFPGLFGWALEAANLQNSKNNLIRFFNKLIP